MATKIYGASDDLIEVEGEASGEVGCYGTDNLDPDDRPMLICSDGTILRVYYGKDDKGIWAIELVERGTLFDRIYPCTNEDARPHSDVACFRDGMKWVRFAKTCTIVN